MLTTSLSSFLSSMLSSSFPPKASIWTRLTFCRFTLALDLASGSRMIVFGFEGGRDCLMKLRSIYKIGSVK